MSRLRLMLPEGYDVLIVERLQGAVGTAQLLVTELHVRRGGEIVASYPLDTYWRDRPVHELVTHVQATVWKAEAEFRGYPTPKTPTLTVGDIRPGKIIWREGTG